MFKLNLNNYQIFDMKNEIKGEIILKFKVPNYFSSKNKMKNIGSVGSNE